jgi:hypothetical protein
MMGNRNSVFLVWGFCLALLPAPCLRAEEYQLIQTNAQDGDFGTGQRVWFSVPRENRLRLLVDGVERFRGTGAASVDLEVAGGEEHEFHLTAEAYSPPPNNHVLESRGFRITIDRKAPEAPQVKLTNAAGGFISLRAEPVRGVRAEAYVDTGEQPLYIPDLDTSVPLPPVSVSALVWAVDAAGNVSAPLPMTFDFPGVRVENPAPGTWANAQRLVITGVEGRAVFWTDDGGDPLGPAGKPYTGPELINKTGEIDLRVGFRHRDGHGEEERIVYRVEPDERPYAPDTGPAEGGVSTAQTAGEAVFFSNMRFLEDRDIRENFTLPLPGALFWSIGGEPRDLRGLSPAAGGNGLVLRPQPGIRRITALHFKAGGGVYRFVVNLDGRAGGGEGLENSRTAGEERGERAVENITFVEGGAPALGEESGQPRIIVCGNSRVLIWKDSPGLIRYCWNDENSWFSGSAPVCIPPRGGRLQWIIDQGDRTAGPFSLRIEARNMPKFTDPSQGRFAYRYASSQNGRGGWSYIPGIGEAETKDLGAAVFDVCDGEDMEWAFITLGGEKRAAWRVDRLLPLPPVLSAPGEAEWRRGPLRVSAEAPGEDGPVKKYITARIRYAAGSVETVRGTGPLVLKSATGEYAEVRLEARIEDAAGNLGPPAIRNFILDPLTVYVSAFPASGSGEGGATGGRDRPFRSLETALDFAGKEGRRNIFLNSPQQLQKNVIADGDLVIDGSFNEQWERQGRSSLVILPGVSLTARRGTLVLRGLDMERRSPGAPFLRGQKNAGLELIDCGVIHLGAALDINSAACFIGNTRIVSLMVEDRRFPAIRAADSRLLILKSDFQLEGGNGLCLEMRGGVLNIEETRFRLNCQKTGTALWLDRVRGEWKNVNAAVMAGDYGSALESSNSELTVSGGRLSVKAQDAVAVLAADTELLFLGAEFLVDAVFVARAFEVRNTFPHVTDCRFIFSGISRQSEVFSGSKAGNGRTLSLLPEAGTVGGNVFVSFTHILGAAYPMENLAGFNRRFAPPGRPNRFQKTAAPGGGAAAGTGGGQ